MKPQTAKRDALPARGEAKMMTTISKEEQFYQEAKNYAAACIGNIREMLEKLEHARECDGEEIDGEPCEHIGDDEWHDEDSAQQAIDDDPLSIQVRADWCSVGEVPDVLNGQFEILLTTGELQDGQPSRAWFEYQDWFKPWTEVIVDSADHATMLEYAQRFYFGE
jgi:hypothetical protein